MLLERFLDVTTFSCELKRSKLSFSSSWVSRMAITSAKSKLCFSRVQMKVCEFAQQTKCTKMMFLVYAVFLQKQQRYDSLQQLVYKRDNIANFSDQLILFCLSHIMCFSQFLGFFRNVFESSRPSYGNTP